MKHYKKNIISFLQKKKKKILLKYIRNIYQSAKIIHCECMKIAYVNCTETQCNSQKKIFSCENFLGKKRYASDFSVCNIFMLFD